VYRLTDCVRVADVHFLVLLRVVVVGVEGQLELLRHHVDCSGRCCQIRLFFCCAAVSVARGSVECQVGL
jgi:hypothetical protein